MKITNLVKTYKIKKGNSVRAVDNISFDLPDSGMVFLLGKSGSGKTTLLNLLGGLDFADSGDIVYEGKSLKNFSAKDMDSYRNTYCGFVFQDYNLLPEFTVKENIALSLQIQGKSPTDEEISAALKEVDLEGYENRKITELSGGQKQRIAIVRALIKNPKILFADEPTGALDSATGGDILNILKKLSKDKLVIVVSHDREYAQKYADRIIELRDGKIISDTDTNFTQCKNESTYKSIKSHLPLKYALKIGAGNFKMHPIKFIVVILLSVISFTFLGSSFTASFFDNAQAFTDYIYENQVPYSAIFKYRYYKSGNTIGLLWGDDGTMSDIIDMQFEDFGLLKENYKGCLIPLYKNLVPNIKYSIAASYQELSAYAKRTGEIVSDTADGYVLMSQSDCEEFGVNVIGRLPENKNEIAINECLLNSYKVKGLIEDDITYQINGAEDVIGHRIYVRSKVGGGELLPTYYKTITGVVDTHYDGNYFFGNPSGQLHYVGNIYLKLFVSEDFFESDEFFEGYSCAIMKTPANKTEFKQFYQFLLNQKKDSYGYTVMNEITDSFRSSVITAQSFKYLFINLSILLIVFTVLFLLKIVGDTLDKKIKQIGILRALGINFEGLLKIFLMLTLSILMPVYILSVLGTILLNSFMNNYIFSLFDITFPIWQFNLLPFLFILILSVTTAFLGCIFPLLKANKKAPAETIRKGQRN